MSIRLIITTYTSERDYYGNCYHGGIARSVETGESVTFGSVGGESNLTYDARSAGFEWEDLHYTQIVVGKREYKRLTKEWPYRATEDTRRELRRLGGLGPCVDHRPSTSRHHNGECRNCGLKHVVAEVQP